MHATMPLLAMEQDSLAQIAAQQDVPVPFSCARSDKTAIASEDVLAALPAAIIVIDALGNICSVNPAASRLLGDSLLGDSWCHVIARSFSVCDEHTVRLSGGQIVEVLTQSLAAGQGQVVLLVDITSGRMADDLDQRHQRLLQMGEMVASIAHQLRTPLATARLHFSALEEEIDTDAAIKRRLQSLRQCYLRLEKMIDDMLVFARGGGLPMAVVSLTDLLADLKLVAEPLCQESGICLSLIGVADEISLKGNHEALLGVLRNLIENSVQAIGHRQLSSAVGNLAGCINVQVKPIRIGEDNDGLEMTVADNGPGLSHRCRQHLFEPFFTTRSHGTGLGLAIARTLIHAHGGEIECLTQGVGTVFQIHLPVVDSVASVDSEASTEAAHV